MIKKYKKGKNKKEMEMKKRSHLGVNPLTLLDIFNNNSKLLPVSKKSSVCFFDVI